MAFELHDAALGGPNYSENFLEAVREMQARNRGVSFARCREALGLVLQANFPEGGTWLAAIEAAEVALQDEDVS